MDVFRADTQMVYILITFIYDMDYNVFMNLNLN